MRVDPLLTTEEHKEEVNRADDIWSEYDCFEEVRDKLDLKPLVISVVSGTFTHPSGQFAKHFVADSANSIVWDYLDDWTPDSLPQDDVHKFGNDIESEVIEQSEQVYDNVVDELIVDSDSEERDLDPSLTPGDVDNIVEEEYDRQVESGNFSQYF
jgi:hypothetical protein